MIVKAVDSFKVNSTGYHSRPSSTLRHTGHSLVGAQDAKMRSAHVQAQVLYVQGRNHNPLVKRISFGRIRRQLVGPRTIMSWRKIEYCGIVKWHQWGRWRAFRRNLQILCCLITHSHIEVSRHRIRSDCQYNTHAVAQRFKDDLVWNSGLARRRPNIGRLQWQGPKDAALPTRCR